MPSGVDDQHAADVRELTRHAVPLVGESSGRRHARDRLLVAGEQVPPAGRVLALPVLEMASLLLGRIGRRVARIEADEDDVEVLARRERKRAQRRRDPFHHLLQSIGHW